MQTDYTTSRTSAGDPVGASFSYSLRPATQHLGHLGTSTFLVHIYSQMWSFLFIHKHMITGIRCEVGFTSHVRPVRTLLCSAADSVVARHASTAHMSICVAAHAHSVKAKEQTTPKNTLSHV